MKLTDLTIKKAKPDPDKVVKLRDEKGLYLEISPGGKSWSWRLRIRAKGKETIKTLGHYPKMTLAKARLAQDKVRDEDSSDSDLPSPPFEQVAAEWIESVKDRWSDDYRRSIQNALKNYVHPEFGSKKINSISTKEISQLLKSLYGRGRVNLPHHTQNRLEAIFRFARQSGYVEVNPAVDLKGVIPPKKSSTPRPAISDLDEFQAAILKLESGDIPMRTVSRLALRFAALTVVRANEFCGAKWSEFYNLDEEHPYWIIPEERMKGKIGMRKAHIVPLTPQSIIVLRILKSINPPSVYVFPRDGKPHMHLHRGALGQMMRRNGFRGIHCTHGFRASFSTIMNKRRPADRLYTDMMLAHTTIASDDINVLVIKNGLSSAEAAYNRYNYINERRTIALDWDALLTPFLRPASELVDLPKLHWQSVKTPKRHAKLKKAA